MILTVFRGDFSQKPIRGWSGADVDFSNHSGMQGGTPHMRKKKITSEYYWTQLNEKDNIVLYTKEFLPLHKYSRPKIYV